jgi:hypothetical protein
VVENKLLTKGILPGLKMSLRLPLLCCMCKAQRGEAASVAAEPATVVLVVITAVVTIFTCCSASVLVVEPVAAWVEHETAAVDTTVGAEAIVAHTVFGVTIVYGVIVVTYGVVVNATVVAVLVTVENLCLL